MHMAYKLCYLMEYICFINRYLTLFHRGTINSMNDFYGNLAGVRNITLYYEGQHRKLSNYWLVSR
uniref:Uncharacterized protein n=1 Tax=Schistosoma mansoni TaxID=6183 RepID=A0A5K4FB91_SCHMA